MSAKTMASGRSSGIRGNILSPNSQMSSDSNIEQMYSKSRLRQVPKSPVKSSVSNKENHSILDEDTPAIVREIQNFDRSKLGTKSIPGSSPEKPRSNRSKGYEYLCRVSEIRTWLSECLSLELPTEAELIENGLRDGVLLATFAQKFAPKIIHKVTPNSRNRLEYRHTENIVNFFCFLDFVDMPELFRFELTDLYEAKNIPKVIFCLYALSYMMREQDCPKLRRMAATGDFDAKLIAKCDKIEGGPDFAGFEPMMLSLVLPKGYFDEDEVEQIVEEAPIADITSENDEKEEYIDDISVQTQTEPLQESTMTEADSSNPKVTFTQSTLRRVENIQKPRYSDFTQSEIEDTTIMHERDADLSENELDFALRSIISVQALGRGFIARYQVFVKKTMLTMSKKEIKVLQSVIRAGSLRNYTNQYLAKQSFEEDEEDDDMVLGHYLEKYLKRYLKAGQKSPKKSKEKLKDVKKPRISKTQLAIAIQSSYRASALRKSLMSTLLDLKAAKPQIVDFQSMVRGEICRFYIEALDGNILNKNIEEFQAICLGILLRRRVQRSHLQLLRCSKQIVELQSISRGIILRHNHGAAWKYNSSSQILINFQAVCRAILVRNKIFGILTDRELQKSTVLIQGVCRGYLVRKFAKEVYYDVYGARGEILELQSIIRAGLTRKALTRVVYGIDSVDLLDFTAQVRGLLFRRKIMKLDNRLHKRESKTIQLQSIIRGVLSRFHIELLLDELHDHEHEIVKIQDISRGIQVRRELLKMRQYYEKNLDKIVKVQGIIRAHNSNDAYRKLLNMPNPTLQVLRQFAYLLTDTSGDVQEEIRLENLACKIQEQTSINDALEHQGAELDAKIALLVRNKMTLAELAKNHHGNNPLNLISSHSSPFSNSQSSSNGSATENTHFKSQRKDALGSNVSKKQSSKYSPAELEPFESLLYVLQTSPEYFVNLFRSFAKTPNVVERVEQTALVCFDLASQRLSPSSQRNEFLFTSLLAASIVDHLSCSENVTEFLVNMGAVSWSRLLSFFNHRETQKQRCKQLFGGIINSVSELGQKVLHSDPGIIYQEIHGKLAESPESAIQDSETRAAYIENLDLLRNISFSVLQTLLDNLQLIPKHIRALCYTVYHSSKKFGEENALIAAASLLFSRYVLPVFTNPDAFGIFLILFSSKEEAALKSNMRSLCQVLQQIVLLKPFSLDSVFFQPLNDYIESSVPVMRKLMKSIMSMGDVESAYGMHGYSDLTSTQKPVLMIKNLELLAIKSFVMEFENEMAPESDSVHEVIGKVSKCKIDTSDIEDIKLVLRPQVKKFVKTKILFTDAKRCLLYMMQVQTKKKTVPELLLSKIGEIDETRYKEIVSRSLDACEDAERRAKLQKQKNKKIDFDALSMESGSSSDSTADVTMLDESSEIARGDLVVTGALADLKQMNYRDLKKHTLELVLELESMGKITRLDNFQKLLNDIANDIKTKHDQRIARSREIRLRQQTLESLLAKEKYLRNLLETYNNYIAKSIEALQDTGVTKKRYLPFSRQYFYQRALKKRGRQGKFGTYKYGCKYLYEHKILVEVNGVKNLDLLKVNFIFSCDEVGVFLIELEGGIEGIERASKLTLEDLLQCQYEKKDVVEVYNGIVKFDTSNLLMLLFKKFYDGGKTAAAAAVGGGAGGTGNGNFGSSFGSSLGSSLGSSFGAFRKHRD